jgi:hypothetical protein
MTGLELAGLGGITVGVRILVSALKQAGLPKQFAPLTAVILGAIAGGTGGFATGADFYASTMLGVLAGGAAVGLYEIGKQATKNHVVELH